MLYLNIFNTYYYIFNFLQFLISLKFYVITATAVVNFSTTVLQPQPRFSKIQQAKHEPQPRFSENSQPIHHWSLYKHQGFFGQHKLLNKELLNKLGWLFVYNNYIEKYYFFWLNHSESNNCKYSQFPFDLTKHKNINVFM